MKRIGFFLLCLVMVLSLCACVEEDVYEVTVDGKTYKVDTVNEIIYEGKYKYRYDFTGTADHYSMKIYYPDESWYSLTFSGYSGGGGMYGSNFSNNYRDGLYASPYTIGGLVADGGPTVLLFNPVKWIVSLVFVGIGLFLVVNPEAVYRMSDDWKFKNAEPSSDTLNVIRCTGVLLIGLVALVIFMF